MRTGGREDAAGPRGFWVNAGVLLWRLQALEWNLCPETSISWLKLYAQVDAQKDQDNFLVPQFSPDSYIQITQVRPPPTPEGGAPL